MAANQEVIDAINGTIVSNNVKGITADSLRNLLLLMAENSGGSGGSGEGKRKTRGKPASAWQCY